jgi:hypothetical protein
MPIFLATTSVSVTDSISPLIGLMSDAYVSSPTTTPAGHGFLVSAARSREWTLSVNTPINPGTQMGAAIRRGSGDLPPALTLVTSSSPQGALWMALGYTLGRTANATHDVTVPAAGTSNPLTADGAGVHFAVSSIAYPLTARAAILYTLDPSYQSALVGGGRVGFMVSKAASAGVYAVPGTPMTMPITQANEALAQVPWPTRGTFTGITVVAYSSTVASGGASPQFPTQFTLRVNGLATAATVTASGTASRYSTSAVASIVVGDLVSLQVQALSWAAGSYFHGWCELQFLPVTATAPEPPPPPPFLGVQAPEGADVFFWQSVASHANLPGWHMTGFVRGDRGANNVGIVGANQQWLAMPYIFPRTTTIGGLGVLVTVAGVGGELARFGVWVARSSNNLYPGSLVADCGIASLASTGLRSVATSVGVYPNHFYFLGLVTSGFEGFGKAVRGTAFGNTADVVALMGVTSHASGGAVIPRGWTVTGDMTYPAVYPNSATLITDQFNMPAIAVRLLD